MYVFLQQKRYALCLLMLCFVGLLALAQPAMAQCPGTASGGVDVVYEGCTESTGSDTAAVLTEPAGASAGDLLLVSISTDGTTTPTPADASGWTQLTPTVSAQGVTMSLWYRFTLTTSAANRTFNFGASEAYVATYMRFTNAEEVFGIYANGNTDPVSPAINTGRANSMVLRLSVKDFRETNLNGGLTQITTSSGGSGGNGIDTAIGYINQAGTGTTGTYAFSNTQNDGWIAATVVIRRPLPAVAFEITHGGDNGSTCTSTLMTFRAINENDGTVLGYTGTLNITAPVGLGDWYSGDEAGTPINNGTANDGAATYTMVAGDAGTVSFNYIPTIAGTATVSVSDGTIDSSTSGGSSQSLFADLCGFTISHDGTHGSCLAAGYQEILVSAVQSDGSTVRTGYTGTITINTSSTAGVWDAVSGEAEGSINSDVNGNVSYTFGVADAGTATLRFTHQGVNVAAPGINFDIFDSIAPTQDALLAENNLIIAACGFTITHDGDAPNCSYELIELSSTQVGNTETITISTSTTAGIWVPETTAGSFSTLPDGDFTYEFGASESVATFRLYHQPTGTVTFDIEDALMSSVDVGADEPLDVGACELIFTAPASGNNCTLTDITLGVYDQAMSVVTGYTGTVTLSTSSGVGSWGQGTATNAPDNSPTVGNGDATLVFGTADLGTVDITLSHDDPDNMLMLNATDSSFGMVTPSQPTVDLRACTFWVNVASGGDTCTPWDINLEVRDTSDVLVSDYVGTATITTTTSGEWSLNGSTDTVTLTNTTAGDATYYFGPSTGGSVTLTFTNSTEVDSFVAVTDGSGLISVDSGHNPELVNEPCKFVISHTDSDVCSPTAVTISLLNSAGMAVSDYEGQIFITTSSSGTWTDGITSGIVDTGSGSANYQFVAPNTGTVTFNFQGLSIDTYDIDVTAVGASDNDGDPTDDPVLEFTACLPVISDFSCVVGNSTSITLTSSSQALGTRAVVMVTGNEGTTAITDAQFNSVSASAGGQLLTVANTSNPAGQRTITEMFTWLDDELPAGAGTFNGTFTADDGQAMCLISLRNINQVYPAGAQLGSAFADGGTIQSSLTSPAVDSIVISGVTNDENDGTFAVNTLGNQLANLNVADDAWTFATGWGTTAGTGTVTVTETYSGTTDKWTHAIAAFAPAPAPLAYFTITHDNSTTSCTMQQVTIEAYDINGNLKNDYTGTITITTDQNHGTWSKFPVATGLTENPLDDDGEATYQFQVGDAGSVTLNFLNPHNETIDFDIVDGSVSDDGSHSPLVVTSCEPIITNTQCYAGTSGSIDIVGSETSSARAVVMSIARDSIVGNDPAIDPSLVRFDTAGTPTIMTQLISAKTTDAPVINTVEMYVIFDTDLPTAAGTYNADFTELSGTFPNTPGMCLTSFYGVAQTLPTAPAVAATTNVITATPASSTTTVTTTGNNALVFSVVSDDRDGGGSYTSDFGTTQWNNETSPVNAIFAGFTDLKAQAGPVSDTVVASGTPNVISHIMASFAPVVAGPPTADDFVPVTLFKTFSGPVSFRAYGSSYRTLPNGNNADACTFENSATGTSVDVDIPGGSAFKGAYLYWTGDGDESVSPAQIDSTVTLVRGATETFSISADEIFQIKNVGSNSNLNFFTGYKDVSTIVNVNGTYTLRDLTSQTGSPWEDTSACAAGWALIVVFENTAEDIQVINLFHGFQPFQNSAFDLVPRNFRIRALDVGNGIPHGQLTHITIEGDDTISSADERLGLQSAPGSSTFNYLTNSFNPDQQQYNSTITRPIFDPYPTWSPTAGVNLDGYEALDLESWGVDVDTHFLQGDTIGTPLYPFGIADPLPEKITTEYSAGQDLVLLVGEVISVTNAPIVDLEVTLAEGPTFVAGGTSTYTIQTINNGDGAGLEGSMTGSATVTITFPAGMTVITGTITATGWSCVANNAPPATSLGRAAVACEYDISTPLAEGASLPDIVIPVALGDETFFPNLVNQKQVVARALYHGGNCLPDPLDDSLSVFGLSPNPDDCEVSPQFDNVQDLEGGAISMNDLEEKTVQNNNIDSVTTTINGPQTDLQITKVAGIFQESTLSTYTITVTNLGPQSASKLMTVTDTLPPGLTWSQAAFDAGGDPEGDWSCSAVGQNVTCTSDTDLGVGSAIDFFIPVILSAPAVENADVDNTACVSIATGNFDTNATNNCNLESVTVQGEPVAAQNKFLISVNQAPVSIGSGTGTLSFEIDDIILFDPVTDVATMFFDDSGDNSDGMEDINALHVRSNGHIILSPLTGTSTIGSPTVTVDMSDLVVYDPILKEATLLFDGSEHFDSGTTNIDAVFEQDNGLLVISTTASASMHAGITWERGDMVRFDPSQTTPTATIIFDAETDIFTADVQLNGTYQKVSSTPTYVVTIGQTNATLSESSTNFTGDDIASFQPGIGSQLEFRGSVPNGVFDALSSSRFIDGVHIVEDGYFGHFSIVEAVSGNTCTPTTVTISKHDFENTVDTGYTGSILIDMDYAGTATITISDGDGTLQNTTGNQYVYTYVPSDMGEVDLSLTVPDDGVNINLDVSNGLRREDSSEDPTLSFSDLNSVVTYGDNFTTNNYTGSSGSSNWETDWVETDPDGSSGASDGNVRVTTGEVYFDNTPASVDNASGTFDESMPALTRSIDLSLYDTADPLVLTFDWRTVSVNSDDVFIVEARNGTGGTWLEVNTFTGLVNTNSGSESYNLTSLLGATTQTVSVRFRVDDNYDVSGNFIIDDVVLTTSTADCGVGSVHHYEIIHSGTGVMCQAYPIQFVAHDIAHTPVAPGLNSMVNLSTSNGRGNWFDSGAFAITDAVLDDGQATYAFGVAQNTFTALYNLTSVTAASETISFNINQAAITELEDPNFVFNKSGFIFKNSTATISTVVSGADLGTQIAGKSSMAAPSNPIYIMAVDSSNGTGNETLPVCSALFGGQTVTVQIEAECVNPGSCSQNVEIDGQIIATHPGYVPGNPGPGTLKTNLDVTFDANGGTQLDFVYDDVGQVTLHAEYEIPLRNIADDLDADFLLSGDDMVGSSNPFVVRPFGFNIDLGAGPVTATTTAGTAFKRAGEDFSVNIQAVTWDQNDDADFDGFPDVGADLANGNTVTPNFGNEASTPTVTLSSSVFLPLTPTTTALDGGTTYSNFAGGQEEHTDISFPEVGIINLIANLDGGDYLGTGDNITGTLQNVGRFTPYQYRISNAMHTNRYALSSFCSPPSSSAFTYMGEALQLTFNIEAENAAGQDTQHYRDGFEKLTSVPAHLTFYASDLDKMTVLSGRLDTTGSSSVNWGNAGTGTITASIVLEKGSSPDGPFDMFALGVIPFDSDSISAVTAQLTLDVGGTNTVSVIPGTTSLRYGRLTIDSTGGSEVSISETPGAGQDIPITFNLEYFDEDIDNFITNALDDCTTLSSEHLSIVPDSYTDDLTDDGSGIGAVTTSPTITIGIPTSTITVLANGATRSTSSGTDVPFYISSPLPANSTASVVGSVMIELDLDAMIDIDDDMTDDVSYGYLKLDWYSPTSMPTVTPYNETQDGTVDNPRAIIDFGSFQGHNRVINWQEILLTPE